MTEQNCTGLVDWTDLQFLVELARHGSLSAAARALGVTHATVARRVNTLEVSFGGSLFRREAGRYVATTAGAHVVAIANEMEQSALRVARAMAGALPEIRGQVRITAIDGIASDLVVPLLPALYAAHPGLDVELIVSSDNLSLARRDADIALRLARPDQGDLFTRKLADIASYRYASRRYLKNKKSTEHRYIGYCDVPSALPEVQALEKFCTSEQIVLRTNNFRSRLAAVQKGLGVGLIPKHVGDPLRDLERLDRTPIVSRELWLVVHRDLRDVPRIRTCIEHINKAASEWRRQLT